MTHLDLTSLNKHQELRTRPPEVTIELSDPDWESKTDEALKRALGIVKHSGQRA
jgi:hypothetical protein